MCYQPHFSTITRIAKIFALILLACSLAHAQGYGTGAQATALNNINVGGPSGWTVAYRFKAAYTSTITGGIYYRITSVSDPGYSAGTLGTIVATIRSDSAGSPGTTLATCTGANTGFFPAFTCSAAVTVGNTYYLVFTNTDGSPTVNYASVDGLYDVGGVADPNFPYTTLISNGGAWTVYPTVQPIFQVNYSNGHAQGNGYMEVWINTSSVTLSASTWARELFTPTANHLAGSVTIGPGAVAGTTVTLSTASGTLIETGTLPAPASTGWATYQFTTPRALASGTQYQLILKSSGTAYPIRRGSQQGFTSETFFPDGHAQFSTNSGSTWTDFNDENLNPSTLGDLEFNFLPPVSAWTGIIDPSRATDWTSAGAAIATRNTICIHVTNADSAATINTKIAGCASGQVVFFDAGTYSVDGFHVNKSNVTLRGAGPLLTIINFTANDDGCSGLGADICASPSSNQFYIGSAQVQPGGSNAATWTGGFAKGATSITVTNVGSSGLTNGQVIILDQANDTTDTGGVFVCDTNGSCGDANSDGRTIGGVDYSQTQVVTVAAGCASACTGAGPFTLTISPGLIANNWRIGKTPGLWWTNRVSGIGIENMTVNHANLTGQAGIYMYDCDGCWIKNVRSYTGARNHIWAYQSSKLTVRDSYFWNTQSHASQSYGLETWITSGVLFENNICQQVASCMVSASGQGNVYAYNFDINNWYSTSTQWQQNISAQHNAGSSFNLYEGNEADGSIYCDNIHGVSGENTEFRNRLNGRGNNDSFGLNALNTFAVSLQYGCRIYNIIGNVLGTSGYHNQYQITSGSTNCDTTIYMMNYTGTECGGPVDTLVSSTVMRWGNYDVVNVAARFDNTESSPGAVAFVSAQTTPSSHTLPASFYLSAQPAWWNTSPFPAIGPEVTGGPGPGGHSYIIPAHTCYNSIGGAANGTGGPLAFDANVCYAGVPPPPPPPPGAPVMHQPVIF